MLIFINKLSICDDKITIAIFMMLLETKMVANKYLTFCKFLIIVLCALFFSFFISDRSEGLSEKKATSEPEIRPEHITSIIQDIKSI